MRSIKILLVSWVALFTTSSFALPVLNPTTFASLTSSDVNTLLQLVAISADHHAYMPASPLGNLLGIDLGIDLTAINVPSSFISLAQIISAQPAGTVPSLLPFPKLNIHKGLPFGIDVGISYMNIPGVINSYGGDIKWAPISGGAKPNLAARFSANWNTVWFMSSSTYSLDAMISKGFFILEPYAGVGLQYWNGSLNIPASAVQLPVGISATASGISPRAFGGLSLKLLILRIVAEADYSFAGLLNYGGKVSISF